MPYKDTTYDKEHSGATGYTAGDDLYDASLATGRTRDNPFSFLNARRVARSNTINHAHSLGEKDDVSPWGSVVTTNPKLHREQYDAWRGRMQEKYPDEKAFFTPLDEQAQKVTKSDYEAYQKAEEGSDNSWGATFSSIGGTTQAMAEDPSQIAAMAYTPLRAAGLGAWALTKWFGKTFAVNAAIETGLTASADVHATKSGVGITKGEYAGRALGAGGGAASLDVAGRVVSRTLTRGVGGKVVEGTAGKGVKHLGKKQLLADEALAAMNAAETPLERARVEAAYSDPSSDVAQLANGSEVEQLAAAKRIATEVGDEEVLSAVSAVERRQTLDANEAAQTKGTDKADYADSKAQATRHIENPGEEMLPGEPLKNPPKKTSPNIASGSKELDTLGKSFEIDGKPATRETMPVDNLELGDTSLQFKTDGDANGINKTLRGVEGWDQEAAGTMVVFEKADGTRQVGDGRQRTKLAKDLRAKGTDIPDQDVIVLKEKDGWTSDKVRAYAAKKNVTEGSGSAVDTARVLREHPEVLDQAMTGAEKNRWARHLAALDDDAFDAVEKGAISPHHAATVGKTVPKGSHKSVVDALIKDPPKTREELSKTVHDTMQPGPQKPAPAESSPHGRMDKPLTDGPKQTEELKVDLARETGVAGRENAAKAEAASQATQTKGKAKSTKPAKPKLTPEEEAAKEMADVVATLRGKGHDVQDFEEAAKYTKAIEIVKGCATL